MNLGINMNTPERVEMDKSQRFRDILAVASIALALSVYF